LGESFAVVCGALRVTDRGQCFRGDKVYLPQYVLKGISKPRSSVKCTEDLYALWSTHR